MKKVKREDREKYEKEKKMESEKETHEKRKVAGEGKGGAKE